MAKRMRNMLTLALLAALLSACGSGSVPVVPGQDWSTLDAQQNPSLRIAVLDYQLLGDLNDPAVMAKYARADLLITQPELFWGRPGLAEKMSQLRSANPNLRIVGYFRTKCIRQGWASIDRATQSYLYDLYHAGLPYLSHTTTGDTVQDWPGVANIDFTDPAARGALLDVFESYQKDSAAKFDGIFWDYFSPALWISPDVTTMEGEPDMDGDGVAHAQDIDEQAAFRDAQDDWVHELRSRMGDQFLQIANGARALRDSTFAGLFDGMLYEIFPIVGFAQDAPYLHALDPAVPNNLWAARGWLRTQNGGPWQILENTWIPRMMDQNSVMRPLNLGDVNRAVALLTDATVIHYDLSGSYRAGMPDVEVSLGAPLGGVTVSGNVYTRAFEQGSVTLTMASGRYPLGFSFAINTEEQDLVQAISPGYIYP